jgi:putative molybdopterin biosynthesis protein
MSAVAEALEVWYSACASACSQPLAPFGLDFVPVAREPHDLVLNAAFLEDPLLGPFWDLLASHHLG